MRIRNLMHRTQAGYALLMVMTVTGIAMLVLAATMGRTLTNANLNSRSNDYSVAGNAAEAAVEKVVARMGCDFQGYGLGRSRQTWASIRRAYRTKFRTGTASPFQMATDTPTKPMSPC